MDKKKKVHYFDFSLLFIIIFLLCFGLVMLYSTSSYNAQLKTGSSTYYLEKQIIASVLGLICMALATAFPYRLLGKFIVPIYILTLVLIALVLTPLGMEFNGARRWIGIGDSLSIQPAEYAKLAIIICMAYVASKCHRGLRKLRVAIMAFSLVIPVVLMILLITNNMSSAIIIAGIGIIILFVASPKYWHYYAMAVAGLAAGIGALFIEGFRVTRIQVWLDPESHEKGYQVLQALYAIGSGGIFGKGLGQSIQKLGFVPEAQNDMIFTIICEELGLVGAIAVLMMFLFMLWRFMIIANNAPDLFGSLLVTGVMAHIAIQVILNVAVVTNSIPNTGITLPFISYGGTSVLFLLTEMGLVLSVSRHIST